MVTLIANNHQLSTARTKKSRENRIKNGFKRVQKWVFDLENSSVQMQMEKEAQELKYTQEMSEWDQFTLEQFSNLEN